MPERGPETAGKWRMQMAQRHNGAWLVMLVMLLVGLATTSGAWAQPGGEERVTAELATDQRAYSPGERGALAVILDIQERWHIYPGEGSGEEVENYIPTTIHVRWPEGWKTGSTQWPPSHSMLFGPEGYQESVRVHEGRVVAYVPFLVGESTEPGEANVAVTVGYQACDDKVCEPPTEAIARMDVALVSAEAAGTVDEAGDDIAALFSDFDAAAGFSELSDAGSAEPDDGAPRLNDEPIAENSESASSTFFGLRVPSAEGAGGLLILAVLSALGGFVLNLTPCVLPVIPIKIMTIMEHANSPGKSLVLGLWMALGVVSFWVGIGIPVAVLGGAIDPSQMFGVWWVTLGIGVLIAAMGVGIMGMFTIQLPQAAYSVNPKADSAWGSFLFGVMTAVLGLPCFGFVAGALLAGAASMPPTTIMIVFTSIGVGMAVPYLVLSMKPGLLHALPKTGPASELVKQVLGLMLLAAAAFFIGSGLIALVAEQPYIGALLHWWVIATLGILCGLWLIVRTFQITSKVGPRAAFTVMGLVLASAATVYAYNTTQSARHDWVLLEEARAANDDGGYVPGIWNEWTRASFEKARADGKIVMLDFTATWCLNCKVLKAAVLSRSPVKEEIRRDDIVTFTVDLTPRTAPGWKFLNEELGQSGIPLLAIYSPGQDEPWMSNAYTREQVMEALSAARQVASSEIN